ncbi:MAG: glycosyltransferase [Oscillospiraceae bacterium]|jgi:glycosyltransferase involved in cell wall biosynthesis|nr:glycosyltransferase [Oscillospiraceae bacterium]
MSKAKKRRAKPAAPNLEKKQELPAPESPKISVIVPVYNCAPYLRTCLNSIRGQSYPKLELIIIDDGSTDGSGKICDEYSDIAHIKHTVNCGVSAARNFGLYLATGEYVTFLDGDDWFEPYRLEFLQSKAQESGADIVLSGLAYRQNENTPPYFKEELTKNCGLYTGKEKLEKLLLPMIGGGLDFPFKRAVTGSCSGLYRHSVLRGIAFPRLPAAEDLIFQLHAVQAAESVLVTDDYSYNYRVAHGAQSRSHRHFADLWRVQKRIVKQIAFFRARFSLTDENDISGYIDARIIREALHCIGNLCERESAVKGFLSKRRAALRILNDVTLKTALYRCKERSFKGKDRLLMLMLNMRLATIFLIYLTIRKRNEPLMQNNAPLVTVLMPAYNVETYINQAIDSVLSQSYSDFEFIIVEDCSTDNTLKLIEAHKDPRITLIRNQENLGLIRTLNKGLEYVHGKYVVRFDSDDVMLPGRIKAHVKFLERHPKIGLLAGWSICIRNGVIAGIFRNSITRPCLEVGLLAKCTICHSCVTYRIDLLRETGLRYSNEYLYMEDYGLWANLVDKTRFAAQPRHFVAYRLRQDSITQIVYQEQVERVRNSRRRVIQTLFEKYGIQLPPEEFELYFKAICGEAKGCDAAMIHRAMASVLRQIPKPYRHGRRLLFLYFMSIWWEATDGHAWQASRLFNLCSHIWNIIKTIERIFYRRMKLKVKFKGEQVV